MLTLRDAADTMVVFVSLHVPAKICPILFTCMRTRYRTHCFCNAHDPANQCVRVAISVGTRCDLSAYALVFWRVRVGILARTHSDCNACALPMVPVRCLQYWWLNCATFDVTKKNFYFASCLFSFP